MAITARKLARMADEYWAARETRKTRQKQVDELKEKETVLWVKLRDSLIDNKAAGIKGSFCSVEVVQKQKPKIIDQEKFHAYVIKNKAWDLLQKSVVAAAARERWEDGKVIPGVVSEPYIDLSVGKA